VKDRDHETGHDAHPEEERVRKALLAFADLIRRLEDEGRLQRATPLLLSRLGDLRRLLFEFEVRWTERLLPIEDPVERDSRRIVREALEREREMLEEWEAEAWPEEDGEGGEEDEPGRGS